MKYENQIFKDQNLMFSEGDTYHCCVFDNCNWTNYPENMIFRMCEMKNNYGNGYELFKQLMKPVWPPGYESLVKDE